MGQCVMCFQFEKEEQGPSHFFIEIDIFQEISFSIALLHLVFQIHRLKTSEAWMVDNLLWLFLEGLLGLS